MWISRDACEGRAVTIARLVLLTEWGFLMLTRMKNFVVDFCKREDGPTAVEYAVMLALIIVVCLAAITTLGQNANTTFTTVGQKIGSASS
jgi:pilus assembly protein Flp/PilA